MRHTASLCLYLLSIPASFAYVRTSTQDAAPLLLWRADSAGIQFNLNNQVVAGAQRNGKTVITGDSDPQGAARAALATWNAVATSKARFLPLKSTAAGINSGDSQMTIAIASDAEEDSWVGSALAVTVVSWLGNGSIVDSDIMLSANPCKLGANPCVQYPFSTTGAANTSDLQAVLTHELGHALGANHSGILGATMFPYLTNNIERTLSMDDIAFVSSVYPASMSMGTVSGMITTTGASPVPYAMLTLIDSADGFTIGGLAGSDGSFSIRAPAGSYLIYAEPFRGVLQPGNFYLTSAQASLAIAFQPTFYGGNSSPATVAVTANNTVNASIAVAAGTSPLQLQWYGLGGAGKSGDIKVLYQPLLPVSLASGQSIDLAFSGPGIDKTLTEADVHIYGQGISVEPGTLRQDIAANTYVMRVTVDIAARENTTLASVFVGKNGNSVSLSGLFVLVPPTPVFTSQGMVSAASFTGNGVSPGEIVSVFGSHLGPTTGPIAGGYVNSGYDGNGFLPPNLKGVSVTFDGVPAPIFFANASQINLQVPFEVAGKTSTQVAVSFFGSPSASITVPVVPIHPALFAIGTAAYVGNSNWSLNTAANAAGKGDYVTVYGTGVGNPAYPIQTGAGAPAPPGSALNANGFTCTIDGVSADVLFTGWSPTAVGLAQWNVKIPATPHSGAVPIVFNNGGASTQSNLTVFVK